mmetsp:Transcript_110786/g.196268  ORF Transcript_110786/g.196268 Transcript_110786/m.196268 type:complete len:110 (+) Transcript_110786:991-1320(+)
MTRFVAQRALASPSLPPTRLSKHGALPMGPWSLTCPDPAEVQLVSFAWYPASGGHEGVAYRKGPAACCPFVQSRPFVQTLLRSFGARFQSLDVSLSWLKATSEQEPLNA